MFSQRNAVESLTIISCGITFISVILHYVSNVSPITGIWFPIYIFVVFIVSVSFSFKFLQWLLHLNKPLKYDLEGLFKEYPYLSFLGGFLPRLPERKKKEAKEYDTNELSVITTVLERKLVSSWYVPYISQEIGFPFACKQMLDQMTGKTFQICNKIEPKDVYVDICSILISHLKEYRKALKRQEKSPTSTIESLYKKSHPISNPDQKLEAADHCTNVIRVILKELVPWELWDTPHSELLVRILSKKLDTFIDSTIADPAWLNDKLLTLLNDKKSTDTVPKENIVDEAKVDVKEEVIAKEDLPEPKAEQPTVESALCTLITKTTAPILQRAVNEDFKEEPNVESSRTQNIIEELPLATTEPLDIKSSPILRQKRGRQGRNEVKIYDRIIEGSVKTWETDIDLQCISLGQDLLASLDGEITLSRLWGQDTETEGSPNPPKSKSPQPLWFGEEDAIDVELSESPLKEPSPVRKEHSPKPADALLKDLQTTVHQAKTKIGDLQVPRKLSIDVPRKQFSGDEAAGMMEGLLDFGIAGLKKGLRFTGLSDDLQEKNLSHREKGGSGEKISPPEIFSKMKPAEPKEMVASTVLQKEENGNGNATAPQLIKQQRVLSQDSVPSVAKPIPREPPPPLASLSDSPEPEYEEAADLSTSIAKLRCLLQQRAESSPRSEEIWWESAVEERGRTHHHHSERPIDTATLADEYDMNIERNVSPGQTSNNMQRLDKLFQRTVTGVFNSIKTAVGAEGEEAPRLLHDWAYVTTSIELSVGGAVARLVGSRRAFTHVDAALDSLHHLAPPPTHKEIVPEDFEEWCAAFGCGWCGLCELAGAAGLAQTHVTHRIATLLCADIGEALIDIWLDELTCWLRARIFVTFATMADDAADTSFSREQNLRRPLDVDHTCAVLMENLPRLSLVFGEETVSRAVRLSVSSVAHKPLCRDVCFRALDAIALRFKAAAALRNPSFDAN